MIKRSKLKDYYEKFKTLEIKKKYPELIKWKTTTTRFNIQRTENTNGVKYLHKGLIHTLKN